VHVLLSNEIVKTVRIKTETARKPFVKISNHKSNQNRFIPFRVVSYVWTDRRTNEAILMGTLPVSERAGEYDKQLLYRTNDILEDSTTAQSLELKATDWETGVRFPIWARFYSLTTPDS
jgi:hypothetical protein